MNLCVCDIKECEGGVGDSVNTTRLSETLQTVGFGEVVVREVRL
jgi:hypothetical protein